MRSKFDEFVLTMKIAEKAGIMKLSQTLSLLDLAVTYAIDLIIEQKGYPCEVTIEDIHRVMMTFTDESIYDKTEPIIGPKGEVS